MRKFSTIRRIYEQEEMSAPNLPQEVTNVINGQVNNTTQAEEKPQEQGQQAEEKPQEQNQEAPKEEVREGTAVALFSKMFESREMAHIYHLQVNGEQGSHAAHTALNDYYDNVLGLIDDLIETYQGQYGIVDGYETIDTSDTKTKDKVEYFVGLAEYTKHARKAISSEDTHLHNIIDEFIALVYKTIYKLKFTK